MPLTPDQLSLGRAILAGGPVTQELLQRELERSGKIHGPLGKAMLQSGFVTEDELFSALLQRLRFPKVNAASTQIPLATVALIPEDVAKRCRVLALDQVGSILIVITPDLTNAEALAEVRQATGNLVTPIQCNPEGFDGVVAGFYQRVREAGLEPAQPVGGGTSGGLPAAGGAPASNGALKAIPVGDANEDAWWRRYASAGPVPAEEASV